MTNATATRANVEALREKIAAAISAEQESIREVGETIRLNPEFQFEEYMASNLLADQLREAGFTVEQPYGGLDTAFRATRAGGGGEGPNIAILAEYDALRGIGHGCGHNLIGISTLATAIGFAAVADELAGSMTVIGCPAEEGGAGKALLGIAGAFDDVDASLMVHYANGAGAPLHYPDGATLATQAVIIEFHGAPAHAAADPYNGVNALNAVIEVFNGINALRQHVRMDARMHGIITNGGEASNVVPKYARCQFGIRAADSAYLTELVGKVRRIAEGAALITGCRLEFTERENGSVDTRPSYTIGAVYEEHMQRAGLDLQRPERGRIMASTDFGSVSHRVPSVCGSFVIAHEDIPGHSQEVVDASGSDFGYDQTLKISTAMAWTAVDLLLQPELLAEAKDEHAQFAARHLGG